MKQLVIPYFPKVFHYVTPVIFLASVYLAVKGYFFWAPSVAILGLIILTTKYVTAIDMQTRQ